MVSQIDPADSFVEILLSSQIKYNFAVVDRNCGQNYKN